MDALGEFVFVVETVFVAVEMVCSVGMILYSDPVLFIDIVDSVTVAVGHQHAGPYLSSVTDLVVVAVRISDALNQFISVQESVKVAVRQHCTAWFFGGIRVSVKVPVLFIGVLGPRLIVVFDNEANCLIREGVIHVVRGCVVHSCGQHHALVAVAVAVVNGGQGDRLGD